MTTLPVYSPHQTELWLTCPIKRWAVKRGYRVREAGRRDLAAVLGIGWAAGLAEYYQTNRLKMPSPELGVAAARERLATMTVPDWLKAQADAIPKRLEAGLKAYQDPLPENWRIVEVEWPHPEEGNLRPDLLMHTGGELVPVDHKVKVNEDRGRDGQVGYQDMLRYRDSWQMYHQARLCKRLSGRLPTAYYISRTVLEPRLMTTLLPFPLDEENYQRWEVSAERVWAQMAAEDAGVAQPWQAAVHHDNYGPCEFYDLCYTYKYHDHLARDRYVVPEERA